MANIRTLHLALFAGAALAAAVLAGLRQILPLREPELAPDMMRYMAAGLVAVDLIAFRALRSRIEPPATGADEASWWRANLGRAVVGWALAEGLALLGSVFYFVSGDVAMLGVMAAGLGLLWLMRPARLTGG